MRKLSGKMVHLNSDKIVNFFENNSRYFSMKESSSVSKIYPNLPSKLRRNNQLRNSVRAHMHRLTYDERKELKDREIIDVYNLSNGIGNSKRSELKKSFREKSGLNKSILI